MNEKEIKKLREEADQLYDKKAWDKLIQVATKLIKLEKESYDKANAYWFRGDAYRNKNKYSSALKDFTQAIRLNPKDADAYYARGTTHVNKNDWNRAIADCTRAIELNLEHEGVYCTRGLAYAGKGNYPYAIADCTTAIQLNPKYADAYQTRGLAYDCKDSHDRAIADHTKAIKLNPKDAYKYHDRGLVYNNKHDWDRAIVDFTRAIKLDPKYADAYFDRGISYYCKGNHDRAIADCTEAIEINPKYIDVYYLRSNIYNDKENYNLAIADCNKIIKLNSRYAEAYYTRGIAYGRKGDSSRARTDFTRATKLDPEYASAHFSHGVAYVIEYKFSRAFKKFNKAIEKDPTLKIQEPFTYIASQISDITSLGEKEKVEAFRTCIRLCVAVGAIKRKLFYVPKKPKSKVAHYTSLHALKSLSTRKRNFRLYNADYMNDPEEGKIFFKIINEYKKDAEIEDIEKIFYEHKAESYLSPAYIGSFVTFEKEDEHKGKLPLWRTYGKHDAEEAAGACLIFDKKHFAREPRNQFGSMTQLQKSISTSRNKTIKDFNNVQELELYEIHYRNANQKSKNVDNELKELTLDLERVVRFIGNLNSGQDKLRELVCELLDSIRFLFKESYYSDENEVRVIKLLSSKRDEPSEPIFDTDMDSIPPRLYIEAPENFRFSEVMLGPRVRHVQPQQWQKWFKAQDEDIKIDKSIINYGNS